MTDEVQKGAKEKHDCPGKDEEMYQSGVELAETAVPAVRPEELPVYHAVNNRNNDKIPDSLAQLVKSIGRLA